MELTYSQARSILLYNAKAIKAIEAAKQSISEALAPTDFSDWREALDIYISIDQVISELREQSDTAIYFMADPESGPGTDTI